MIDNKREIETRLEKMHNAWKSIEQVIWRPAHLGEAALMGVVFSDTCPSI